jgi:nitrate/TMAO reductase-like tetraheme cytochrome c subunit
MATGRSPPTAAISPSTMHRSLAPSYTCIDCHKGIAHTLPKGN